MSFPHTLIFQGRASDVVVNVSAAACVEFRYKIANDKMWGVSIMVDGDRLGPFLRQCSAATLERAYRRYKRAAEKRVVTLAFDDATGDKVKSKRHFFWRKFTQ